MAASALSQELRTPFWSRKLDDLGKSHALAKYVKELGIQPSVVFESMLRSEREHTFFTSEDHPYLKYRRIVADWIVEIGDYFNMQRSTTYSAICLLDRIKPDDRYKRFQWQLIAVCCFLLAAKYNECEEDIPALPKLEEITQESLPNKLILSYELWVLNRVDWDVSTHTSLHFIDYFLLQASCLSSVFDSRTPTKCSPGFTSSAGVTPIQIRAYTEVLAHHCTLDFSFKQFRQSATAAAILLVARKRLQVWPVWSEELCCITSYTETDLEYLVQAIEQSHHDELTPSIVSQPEAQTSTPSNHKSYDDDADYTSPRAIADVA